MINTKTLYALIVHNCNSLLDFDIYFQSTGIFKLFKPQRAQEGTMNKNKIKIKKKFPFLLTQSLFQFAN